jgi:hypothetical protein
MKLSNLDKGLLAGGGLILALGVVDLSCNTMEKAHLISKTRAEAERVAKVMDRFPFYDRKKEERPELGPCEVWLMPKRDRFKPFGRYRITYQCGDYEISCRKPRGVSHLLDDFKCSRTFVKDRVEAKREKRGK